MDSVGMNQMPSLTWGKNPTRQREKHLPVQFSRQLWLARECFTCFEGKAAMLFDSDEKSCQGKRVTYVSLGKNIWSLNNAIWTRLICHYSFQKKMEEEYITMQAL